MDKTNGQQFQYAYVRYIKAGQYILQNKLQIEKKGSFCKTQENFEKNFKQPLYMAWFNLSRQEQSQIIKVDGKELAMFDDIIKRIKKFFNAKIVSVTLSKVIDEKIEQKNE